MMKWKKLRKLRIDENRKISWEGISYVIPNSFPAITHLSLDSTTLGYEGVNALMEYNWSNLRFLSLSTNEITFR